MELRLQPDYAYITSTPPPGVFSDPSILLPVLPTSRAYPQPMLNYALLANIQTVPASASYIYNTTSICFGYGNGTGMRHCISSLRLVLHHKDMLCIQIPVFEPMTGDRNPQPLGRLSQLLPQLLGRVPAPTLHMSLYTAFPLFPNSPSLSSSYCRNYYTALYTRDI
ncbi:hypothetical protein L211DRAFT_850735 [Terfezia boudieri ATCC MYA-4762]|uniref:Uncharacterized protein n=1 Tax=Terfezia boudieri ATCC MYA-4762 TaxID=1051890 RepID=A0A3N4LL34_9PEZI|nr:hypothetical protein L211DRAFT_850735 [Terfezia boudieri ATCC MYA-4762]